MTKKASSPSADIIFRKLVPSMLVAAYRQKKRVHRKVIHERLQDRLAAGEENVEALRRHVLDGIDDEVSTIFGEGQQFSKFGDGRGHKRRLGE